jgi:hypothetical protein
MRWNGSGEPRAAAPPVSKEEAAQHRAAPASVFEAACVLACEISQGVWLTPGNGGEIVEGLVRSGNAFPGQPPVAVLDAVYIGRLASRREHFFEKLLWRARRGPCRRPMSLRTCAVLLDHVLRADLMLTGLAINSLLFAATAVGLTRLLASARRAGALLESYLYAAEQYQATERRHSAAALLDPLSQVGASEQRLPPASQRTRGERKIDISGSTNVSPISRRAIRSGVCRSAGWKRSIGSRKPSALKRKV